MKNIGTMCINVLLFYISIYFCSAYTISDSDLYSLSWPGALLPVQGENHQNVLVQDDNSMIMITEKNEKYKCILPNMDDTISREEKLESYQGPSPFELIEPLFKQTTCSYRLESYWTYELCHGRFLRQYHEDKELGKTPKLQEYILGRYKSEKEEKKPEKTEQDEEEDEKKDERAPAQFDHKKIPVLKVEGIELPYYEIPMEGGTSCDLTGSSRRAFVRYVCQPDGKGEVYEFKEIATCEYALVVLTSVLCTHPAFETKKDPINNIQCHSLESSPRRPLSLENIEMESGQGQYNRRQQAGPIRAIPKKPERTVKEHVYVDKKVDTPISASTDKQLLNEFLRGDYCIQGGGSAWWKHEFCFGKRVIQYHEDKKGKRTEVILGIWDEDDHLAWVEDQPTKQPKQKEIRKHLQFFYGRGDVCDLTKKKRFTEVKIKCKDNTKQPHAISIYLVEPQTCEYLLVVESAIFCDLVKQGDDETGILKVPTAKP